FPANPALEGLMVPQVPRIQFTIQALYTNPKIATVGIQARAASTQFDDDQNLFPLDPYFTLDFSAARHLNRTLEIFGAVENLFNQRYEVGKTPITPLGPPILARFGLRVHFGHQKKELKNQSGYLDVILRKKNPADGNRRICSDTF